ncbi:MAG TPA: decaprenylphospho-beta-D-erythro-pentofuranosid-2-ulose 2-reductase [Actinobacteria bacterium]|jgi:decaprenylphospho-beta-D-erythro-pentofuranosid-2-ulose 2-reductase|nr:decaprenylphospho-beta-D-erythro-pentofuranosid-2-ulose 2-reductase [Actinomycetota bacterium]HCP62870.1 decaprenylphospho-beta-D-erythro-pentofuranosid-2-ulose 2-reductase [Actinomycetota bacterium]
MRTGVGSVQSVLVLGGGSDIALATARRLVAGGARTVVLAGRKPDRFQPAVEELRRRGASRVEAVGFDAADPSAHATFVDGAFDLVGGDVDVVLVAFGVHGGRGDDQLSPGGALEVMTTNYLGAVSVLLHVVPRLRDQGHGRIVVLSSVAGERGRKKNFVYGSTKAGLDTFAQGLGDTLDGTGVGVTVIRPGFVHTKMTAGMPAPPLATTAERVAEAVERAIRTDAEIMWVPPAMRWVMSGLRHLPRSLFRRLEI